VGRDGTIEKAESTVLCRFSIESKNQPSEKSATQVSAGGVIAMLVWCEISTLGFSHSKAQSPVSA
jgi:hypothetical protein